jgi:apolipoprotein N-acyltransferase
LWLAVFLSALIFNLAFSCPDTFGILILLAPVPLLCRRSEIFFRYGFVWGLLVFGFHFHWLYQVMYQHSQAPWWLCGIVFVLVFTYFSVTSGLWFWLMQWSLGIGTRYCARISFALSLSKGANGLLTIAYWWVMERWILCPVGLGIGYPFINPGIPLVSYPFFLKIVTFVFSCGGLLYQPIINEPNVAMRYVAPVVNRVKNTTAPWRHDPVGVGQQMYRELVEVEDRSARILRQAQDERPPLLFLAPESMFPFVLNKYPDLVKLWTTALPDNGHLLLGSVFQHDGKYYQAVFWLRAGLIIKVYVKKLLTPFVEKIPDVWKNSKDIKDVFLHNAIEFTDDDDAGTAGFFDITPGVRIIPRICLEFFFSRRADFEPYVTSDKQPMIIHFANDSWFNGFFRKILVYRARLKQAELGIPVVWVGHYEM